MYRFKLLTKIQLRNVFEEHSTNKKGKTSKSSRVLVTLVLFGVMSVYFYILNRDILAIGYLIPVFSLMILTMGISFAQGILFSYKDGDMLRAMPFTDKEIAASKMTVYMAILYSYFMAILIPFLLIHGISHGEGALFYVFALVGSLFVPLLPATLAALLGLWLTKISAGKKHEDAIKNSVTFIAMFVLCFASGMMSSGLQFDFKYYLPSGFFASALLEGSWRDFIIFVAANVAAMIFFIAVFSGIMLRTGALTKQAYHEKNFRAVRTAAKKPFAALRAKEFRFYFKNFTYVINTVIGLILILVAAVVVFCARRAISEAFAESGIDSDIIMTMVALITGAAIGMSCTTGPSISLEGKSLWIIKSMPFKTEQIFLAKFLVNFTVTIIPGVTVIVLMSAGFGASVTSALLSLCYTFLMSAFTGMFGLLMNLRFPRLDFENEAQAIQQSGSAGISIIVPLVINILLIVAYVYFGSLPHFLPIVTAAVAAADVVMFVLLKGWGVRRFAEL